MDARSKIVDNPVGARLIRVGVVAAVAVTVLSGLPSVALAQEAGCPGASPQALLDCSIDFQRRMFRLEVMKEIEKQRHDAMRDAVKSR
jgi:hypothetical protein